MAANNQADVPRLVTDDVIALDPYGAAEEIRRVVRTYTDGRIYRQAVQLHLNTDCDILTMRNRIERYEMRRHIGPDAAPWSEIWDELQPEGEPSFIQSDIASHGPGAESSRPAAGQMNRNHLQPPTLMLNGRTVEDPATTTGYLLAPPRGENGILPTGQSFGPYRDPVTFCESVASAIGGRSENFSSSEPPVVPTSTSERRERLVVDGRELPIDAPPNSEPRAQSIRRATTPMFGDNQDWMELTDIVNPTADFSLPDRPAGPPSVARIATSQGETVQNTSHFPIRHLATENDSHEASMGITTIAPSTGFVRPIANQGCYVSPPIAFAPAVGAAQGPSMQPRHYAQPAFTVYADSQPHPTTRWVAPAANPSSLPGIYERTHGFAATQSTDFTNAGQSPPIMWTRNPYVGAGSPPSYGFFQPQAPPPFSYSYQPPIHSFAVPTGVSNATDFASSTFTREKQTCQILAKWHISFKGNNKKDPEGFLRNLLGCRQAYGLTLEDLVRALPSVIDDETWHWFRREHVHWSSYEDFVDAFRLQFCVEDIQEQLRGEIERRTQGPLEDVCTYVTKLRDLMDQVSPPMPLEEQLSRAYRNFHPSYRQRIFREHFRSFTELQKLGKKEELRRTQDRAYRPPPPPMESLFPHTACATPKEVRKPRLAPVAFAGEEAPEQLNEPIPDLAPVAASMPSKSQQKASKRPRKPSPAHTQLLEPEAAARSVKERKKVDPCFGCGRLGHWIGECSNTGSCLGCGKPNTRVLDCVECKARRSVNSSHQTTRKGTKRKPRGQGAVRPDSSSSNVAASHPVATENDPLPPLQLSPTPLASISPATLPDLPPEALHAVQLLMPYLKHLYTPIPNPQPSSKTLPVANRNPSLLTLKVVRPKGDRDSRKEPSEESTPRTWRKGHGARRPGCWNCGGWRHSWKSCSSPPQQFCQSCGLPDVARDKYPDCRDRCAEPAVRANTPRSFF